MALPRAAAAHGDRAQLPARVKLRNRLLAAREDEKAKSAEIMPMAGVLWGISTRPIEPL
jgi:hypothetical protein